MDKQMVIMHLHRMSMVCSSVSDDDLFSCLLIVLQSFLDADLLRCEVISGQLEFVCISLSFSWTIIGVGYIRFYLAATPDYNNLICGTSSAPRLCLLLLCFQVHHLIISGIIHFLSVIFPLSCIYLYLNHSLIPTVYQYFIVLLMCCNFFFPVVQKN